MFKSILISTVILLLMAGLTFSQDYYFEREDGTPDKDVIYKEKKIPQYLLDQLEEAQRTENVAEENRIMNILNTNYFDVTFDRVFMPDDIVVPGSDAETHNPPYIPDWTNPDRLVMSTGSSANYTNRTLDMKWCEEDGKLYIAFVINTSSTRGVRVYSSSNSGLTWVSEGGLNNNTYYWTGLTMTVDQSWSYRPDSVRVNLFVTRSTSTNNDGAHLRFYSCKPSNNTWIQLTVASPSSGNEFRWPSAYSNGQFAGSGTDIGCIVGEYNNALTSLVSRKQFYMANWGWTFTTTTYSGGNDDWRPSAVYKNNASSTDSVYIAFERRFSSDAEIRVLRARYYGGQTSWPYFSITNGTGIYNRNPCLAIQDRRYPDKMVITYTANPTSGTSVGTGRRSYSYSGGIGTWTHAALGNSATTRFTWVSVDTNGSSTYCTYLWGDTDSINTAFSNISATVNIAYDLASNTATGTCFPVSVVYNNSSGNFRRPGFTYWGTGPQNIYYDGQNLPTGISNTNGIAKSYNLSQNFPNPFNPTTSINFSIPKDGLVKLVVYDMLGKEVATIVNSEQTAGTYQVTFDASKLTSGVYFYKLTSGDFSDVKKMLLVK